MNKENKILLSICLPTYNQPQDLKRTLLSIISQLNKNTKKEIEILIGDNSTNNETQKLVQKEFNFNFIRYFNNKGNLGVDRNILNLIENSKGEYIWLIGDDMIEQGGLDYILNLIRKNNELIFIWVNFKDIETKTPYMAFPKDIILSDGKSLLKILTYQGLIFISTYIFNRKYLNQISINERIKFLDSGINHFSILLSLFRKYNTHKIYIVRYPYVIFNKTPIKWDVIQILGINYYDMIKYYKELIKINSSLEEKLLKESFEVFVRTLFLQCLKDKSVRKKTYKNLFAIIKRYWRYYRFWIILPFLILPNPLGHIGLLVYKKFLKNKKIFQDNLEIFKEEFKNFYEKYQI